LRGQEAESCDVLSVGISGSDALPLVTISGQAGSGTSTLVEGLCDAKGWEYLNGGMIFRSEAERRGMKLSAFAELCREDLEVDKRLDEELKRHMLKQDGPQVVESRLAGWWAYQLELPVKRVWLEVSIEERSRRVVQREGGDLEFRKQEILARESEDLHRFQELYQLDPADKTPYTDIVDADELSAEEVLSAVLKIIEEVSD